MNWDAIGALAELAGAAGVIATLIYLSVQMRQNTTLLRSTAASAVRTGRSAISLLLVSDQNANRIFWTGIVSRSALSDEDRQIFDPLMGLVCENWQEGAELGVHGEYHGEREYLVTSVGFQEYWAQWRVLYRPAFRQLIDKDIADFDASSADLAAQHSAAAGSA